MKLAASSWVIVAGRVQGVNLVEKAGNILKEHVEALFPSNAHWAEEPPFPEFSGAPVVDVMDEVKSRISAAETGLKK